MALSLKGHLILVVEDEPLVAGDVVDGLLDAGAHVLVARRKCDALKLVDHQSFDGAVLDWMVPDGNVEAVCRYLDERGVPYVIYSGLKEKPESRKRCVFISKPSTMEHVIGVLAQLVRARALEQ